MSNTRIVGRLKPSAYLIAVAILAAVGGGLRPTAQQPPAAPQQPTDVELVISGDGGTPPRYAVPDFIAVTPDMAEVAKVIGPVLFDDFAFEREVSLVARDVVATVPAARTADQVPFNSWREVGADAVVFGSVQRSGNTVSVQVRLFNVRTRQQVFGQEYTGPTTNPRGFAHRIADDIHKQQRNLRGVAQSKIAFVSDRTRETVAGSARKLDSREIYIADYDGANQRRATVSRDTNANPSWAPDGSAIAYSSWRSVATGGQVDILLSHIYKGLLENPTKGVGNSYHPAYSPNGSQIAFTSSRDGDPEIYVMNRDGSNARRLTNNNAIDSSPTWSPGGNQIAFVSNRASPTTPRLYLMNADGSGQRPVGIPGGHVDKPTWAPAPYNEIAYSARVGGGFDIHVYDIATQVVRSVTSGEGSNESPAYSANGKHIAFSSTRQGCSQIFTIGRDGRGVRQITREGTNTLPAWSN
jgi:TolB protein